MPWMMLWAGGYPVAVAEARGSRIRDVDGHEYADLCLGDTGAMAGHSPPPVLDGAARAGAGITTMLPTEDAAWVGEELTRRFGLARWLFTLTATDANRSALRLARQLTGRPKVLVFSYCYHGSVDEAFAVADGAGGTVSRAGQRRAAGRSGGDDARRSSSTTSPALERGARGRRRRLRARRAGDDQHRHRAARGAATTRRCARSPASTARC